MVSHAPTEKAHSPSEAGFVDNQEGQIYEYHESKVLRRKIDRLLLPFLCTIYFLQYLDKTLLNYASVMGLRPDTGLTSQQYSNLGTIFYVGYLVFEPPTNFLMQRFPLAKYLGLNIILWGIITACHGAANNYATLMVLRTLLGIFESCVATSLILITGMWYTRAEQVRRAGLWYLMIGVAQIIGAAVSYGFQQITNSAIENWRILFIVLGLITVVVGALTMLFLPDNPQSAKFLTPEERREAIEHVKVNMTGIENKTFKGYQVRQALSDPQSWFLVLITILAMIDNGAVSNFSSIIISGFGYTNEEATILQIPSGVVSIIAVFVSSYLVARYARRALFIGILCIPSVVGAAILIGLPRSHKVGQLFGLYLLNFAPALLPIVYSWASSNVAGHTKKVTVNAMILMAFCIGNIIGPQMFQVRNAPHYIPAKVAIMITLAACVVVAALLQIYTVAVNKRRDRAAQETNVSGEKQGLDDVTDGDNPAFRYVY